MGRIQGCVIVKCDIGADGKVHKAKAVSGHPMLTTAAEVVASNRRYTPFTKDGTPVEAETYVIETFKLQ
jgi:outer membrane biosynthesis protein TonB